MGIKAEAMGVPPVVSVDIPSGWHVENGDTEGTGFLPEMLVFTFIPHFQTKTKSKSVGVCKDIRVFCYLNGTFHQEFDLMIFHLLFCK